MPIDTFHDLYVAELAEAGSIEALLTDLLPALREAIDDSRLTKAVDTHFDQARVQEQTLKTVLDRHEIHVGEHTDQAMQALLRETRKMIDLLPAGALRDAGLIASLQRIKHYEIATYGTLATYAGQLGLNDDKQTLGHILEREKSFDGELTRIAETVVQPRVAA
jgi:ferritin-like metal-binding protein YciE